MFLSKSGVVLLSLMLFAEDVAANCYMYVHRNYDGRVFNMSSDDSVPYVGDDWNDKVSSVIVSESCRLVVYLHRNYGGDRRVFTSDAAYVGDLWNDEISSAECLCR